jgi:hypothetical protein
MSKKTRQKAQQLPLEPPKPVQPASSGKAFWRRNGWVLALGLFIFSNIALRAIDTGALPRGAFGMVAALTVASVGVAGSYGLQFMQTSRRARLENWQKADWEAWRNGHG